MNDRNEVANVVKDNGKIEVVPGLTTSYTVRTSCEAPESNTIDSGAIQINCIIIIILSAGSRPAQEVPRHA